VTEPGATIRHKVGAIRIAVVLTALALAVVGASPALASRAVRYRGYSLTVPSSWRVVNLARTPDACVRFNRHAVYLGLPSADQNCPAHEVGRTEAILLEPLRAAAAGGPRGPIVAADGAGSSIDIRSAGLTATVTWSRQRHLLSRILGRPLHAATRPLRPRAGLIRDRLRATASPAEALGTGLGFDACSAPSSQAMSAWKRSPYRTVGVYIGGINEGCSQPNLTAGWVSGEVGTGWQLIPTYVGLQGRGSCGGKCATISPGRATSQGTAAARDAVARAQALGIPAGNPIYDDMEAYTLSASNTAAVLAFLSGWTNQLHADGYVSGVYGSAASGITTLVRAEQTDYTEPDDIWIGDWNGARTTKDPYVPSVDWPGDQRLHQYRGGHDEAYGGVQINIDDDFLGGATADTSSPIPDNTFVEVDGTDNVFRIAGGAPLYVSDWSAFGGPQAVELVTPRQFSELPPYPANGTFLTTTTGLVYRVAGGAPILVSNWDLFGAEQPSVTVDEWDLLNMTNPLAHLRPVPLNGTVVRGLPSQAYWSFASGLRRPVRSNAAAVAVDDQGLAAFAETTGAETPAVLMAPRCVVPALKRLSLARARSALRRAHCRIGTVRRPRTWSPNHLLRVTTQSAAPHTRHQVNYRVNLRLR
jgi:glycoside hydrolase-like protein